MDKVGATEGFKGPGLLGKGAMIDHGDGTHHDVNVLNITEVHT